MHSSVGAGPFWRGKHLRVVLIFLLCLAPLCTMKTEGREAGMKMFEINGSVKKNLKEINREFLASWFIDIINPKNWPISKSVLNEVKIKTDHPGPNPRMIKLGDRVILKVGAGSREVTRGRDFPMTSILNAPGKRRLLLPVAGRLTSPFGRRGSSIHYGIDLAAAAGTPVKAAASGTVDYAGWASGYGLLVILNHSKFRTFYAHNSRLRVIKGELITAGQVISEVGKTGRATGNHLHFEVEVQGVKVNPLPYLKK